MGAVGPEANAGAVGPELNAGAVGPEDYAEPRCVLCDEPYSAEPRIKTIPQQRIIAKMDDYMSRRDYDGAERHLLYWLEEARLGNDERGELMVRNELIGHYRKTGNKVKAFAQAEAAVALTDRLGFAGTRSGGTTYVNAATAMNAFGENGKALDLFEKARACYEGREDTPPGLLGGLCNNMGLACMALGRYAEALAAFQRAISYMKQVKGGDLEEAITCLNMAQLAELRDGMENGEKEIGDLCERAYALLKEPEAPADGYYAFVLEKCAPSFSYYGYFLEAEELRKRAEEIYSRIGGDSR